MTTSDFTLSNGLRVIVSEQHSSPVAAISIWVRAGACEEPPDQRGIAHVVEHMMFRGSKRFPGKEHTHRIQRMGGDCNAYATRDVTVYHDSVPADRLREVLEMEADRFKYPSFSAEDTAIERNVILEEIDAIKNQPHGAAFKKLFEYLGEGHPYAIQPGGIRQHVEKLTPASLQAFHSRWYVPRNTFIVICGAVQTAQTIELVRQHFEDWTAAPQTVLERPKYRPKLGSARMKLPFAVPLAVRAFALKPTLVEDEAALQMLLAVLAKSHRAILVEELVRRLKLCIFADGNIFHGRTGGVFALYGAFLPPGRFKTIRGAITELCDRMCESGPEPESLAQNIKHFKKQRLKESYHPLHRMNGLGNAELLKNDYRYHDRILADYAGVTPGRVCQLARALFAAQNTLELDILPQHFKRWMWLAGLWQRIWRR